MCTFSHRPLRSIISFLILDDACLAPYLITANYFGSSRIDVNKWFSLIKFNRALDLHTYIRHLNTNYFHFEIFVYRIQFNIIYLTLIHWFPNDCWFLLSEIAKTSEAIYWFIWYLTSISLQYPHLHSNGARDWEATRRKSNNCLCKNCINEIYVESIPQ